MLVGGHAVTPIDWWSEQWIEDRVLRKLHQATTPGSGEGSSDGLAAGEL
jgi:hypothetical protein